MNKKENNLIWVWDPGKYVTKIVEFYNPLTGRNERNSGSYRTMGKWKLKFNE